MLAIHVVSMQYAQGAAGSIERNSLRRGAESASGGVGCRDDDGDRSGVVGCIRVAPMGVHRAPVGSPRRVDASTVASRGGGGRAGPLCAGWELRRPRRWPGWRWSWRSSPIKRRSARRSRCPRRAPNPRSPRGLPKTERPRPLVHLLPHPPPHLRLRLRLRRRPS